MAHRFGIFFLMLLTQVLFAQRGQTGDKTFADRYPEDVVNPIAKTYLLVKNTVDHDIIVCVRDQYKNYLNHVYIRNKDEYLFTGMPISRVYLQYKSKEFYFEDTQKTVINFGERHTFTFFYDASMEGNFMVISEEDFFKP
ncbi:MAG: Uncharacterised protein [Flavobacteriaceae bacterium]|nr:MAG: Uncharacterised protein [Flavobacteriaceae bacterium]